MPSSLKQYYYINKHKLVFGSTAQYEKVTVQVLTGGATCDLVLL